MIAAASVELVVARCPVCDSAVAAPRQVDEDLVCAEVRVVSRFDGARDSVLDIALLEFAPILERITRLTYTAQIHLTGEIDTRRLASTHGCPNTATLLRNTLQISAHDAATRGRSPRPTNYKGLQPRVRVQAVEVEVHDREVE